MGKTSIWTMACFCLLQPLNTVEKNEQNLFCFVSYLPIFILNILLFIFLSTAISLAFNGVVLFVIISAMPG